MHASYIRPGGVAFDLPHGFIDDVVVFINSSIYVNRNPRTLSENRFGDNVS